MMDVTMYGTLALSSMLPLRARKNALGVRIRLLWQIKRRVEFGTMLRSQEGAVAKQGDQSWHSHVDQRPRSFKSNLGGQNTHRMMSHLAVSQAGAVAKQGDQSWHMSCALQSLNDLSARNTATAYARKQQVRRFGRQTWPACVWRGMASGAWAQVSISTCKLGLRRVMIQAADRVGSDMLDMASPVDL